MELLKQLEQKLHGLVAQRSQLMAELERIKGEQGGRADEVRLLQGQIEKLQAENAALVAEKGEIRDHVESILKQLEALS